MCHRYRYPGGAHHHARALRGQSKLELAAGKASREHAERARAASERVRRQLQVEELQVEERRRQREHATAVAFMTAQYARSWTR